MGLPININQLISKETVESERIEFKEGFNPEEIVHSICAFANDVNNWGGGYIILGIKEVDGEPELPPVGLQKNQLDPFQKKLIELSYLLEPNYTPVVEPFVFQKKHILVIWVPGGDNRPYKAPFSLGQKGQKVYWIRKGSKTVQAKGQDEQKLLEQAKKVPFDDRVNHSAEVADLDLSLIQAYLKEVGSDLYKHTTVLSVEEIARKMNIARGSTEYLKPVNVGLLMFNEHPENFFRGAEIQVVTYQDEVGDNFSEKKFNGPLHTQLKDVLHYMQVNVIKEKVRKLSGQAKAARYLNYPYEAIEEALANAVYHKSYEHQSGIEVNIRLDKIEILSFPGPLPPLDSKMLKQNRIIARDYRNRRIGDFLKELRLTEGRGTGIPKIRTSMKANGSPNPSFETDENNTYFLTYLPIHPGFVQITLDEHKTSVLKLCQKPQSRKNILKKLGLTNHYENFRRHVMPLLEAGYLDYTMPDIPNSRKQQYVTSTLGSEKLKNHS